MVQCNEGKEILRLEAKLQHSCDQAAEGIRRAEAVATAKYELQMEALEEQLRSLQRELQTSEGRVALLEGQSDGRVEQSEGRPRSATQGRLVSPVKLARRESERALLLKLLADQDGTPTKMEPDKKAPSNAPQLLPHDELAHLAVTEDSEASPKSRRNKQERIQH